ncbi:helix-turn-helix domain-containing protein [Sporosarcina sp. ACRSM]|uniref:helix-turn-helix domain-containing protein n=1 Tax=Sporosarcina sp. ACRSM TaxID=2918216 RepID=UPI001EF6843C|nr:helix-turn-helix domain-containing protein [Sporosarcina sp. ACRSM]MCG7334025.1 helix-turn-helix domain-containing protein [Sporosarcina sp. ACRSM]
MAIFLAVLFFIQIIVAYFLVLLYTKVSKFDDLEKKQRQLMNEMDDSIGAYLAELKDENERLIAKLAERQTEMAKQEQSGIADSAMPVPTAPTEEPQPGPAIGIPKVPVNIALQTYENARAVHGGESDEQLEREPEDDRTRALEWHRQGYSIEEIAKKLGKGKTEVELMLKFR